MWCFHCLSSLCFRNSATAPPSLIPPGSPAVRRAVRSTQSLLAVAGGSWTPFPPLLGLVSGTCGDGVVAALDEEDLPVLTEVNLDLHAFVAHAGKCLVEYEVCEEQPVLQQTLFILIFLWLVISFLIALCVLCAFGSSIVRSRRSTPITRHCWLRYLSGEPCPCQSTLAECVRLQQW